MDRVIVRGLRADTVIGVYDWERRVRQRLLLDLELAGDCRRAAADDNLADALDYAGLSERVVAFVEGSDCRLIETLAERVADLVLAEFAVPWLRLTVHKPGAVAAADDVAVMIERGERP